MNYILLIGVGLIAFFLGKKLGKNSLTNRSPEQREKIQESSRAALSERTQGRKNEILKELQHRKELDDCRGTEKEGVTRREVEDLLDVSRKTAWNYLNELEDDGKVLQVGESGPDVYYILIK